MMKKTYLALPVALLCLALASCGQAAVDDANGSDAGGKVTVSLSVAQLEQVPFSQAKARQGSRGTKIDSVCSKLCFAVYKSETDSHPSVIRQNADDDGFGSVRLSLDRGTYYLVVLAHRSGIDPDMSNIRCVDFSTDVTDTFYAFDTLAIDRSLDREIKLRRAVARFELTTTDNVPDTCTSLRLSLGNVCTAFNPVTGYGTAPGRTTYTATFGPEGKGKPFSFGRCFFPAGQDSKTDVTVTLYNGTRPTFTRTFTGVPIGRNTITRYEGRLFSNLSFTVPMQSDDEWQVHTVTF